MTPRTFHNVLKGRSYEIERKNAEWEQRIYMQKELVFSILAPHMKQVDRDAAFRELFKSTNKKAQKKDEDPLEFWAKIDGK